MGPLAAAKAHQWTLVPATPAGTWVTQGTCRRTPPNVLDWSEETTALAAIAACETCPVLDQCRAWQEDQAEGARAWGVVGGAWWGLPSSGTRWHRIVMLDARRVQARAITRKRTAEIAALPIATSGQGVLIHVDFAASAPRIAHKRPRRSPVAGSTSTAVAVPLWCTWSDVAPSLEAA